MNRIISRRSLAALGIATTIAVAVGIEVSSAQTEPRALPNLNQQERQYDRGPGGQYSGQYGGQPEFGHDRGLDVRDRRGSAGGQERLERRLAFLHTRLRITPAQERAWTAFAGVLQEEARDGIGDRGAFRGRGERGEDLSVIERLEMRQHRLADRSADLDRVIRAVQPLYGQFSDDQKRIADRLMFRPERMRRMADAARGRRGFARDGIDRGGMNRGGIDRRYDGRNDR